MWIWKEWGEGAKDFMVTSRPVISYKKWHGYYMIWRNKGSYNSIRSELSISLLSLLSLTHHGRQQLLRRRSPLQTDACDRTCLYDIWQVRNLYESVVPLQTSLVVSGSVDCLARNSGMTLGNVQVENFIHARTIQPNIQSTSQLASTLHRGAGDVRFIYGSRK